MESAIKEITESDKRPKLLLHACCAPCLSGCIDRLKAFDVTVYFYNPNMDTSFEYDNRAKEIEKLCKHFGLNYVIEDYSKDDFYIAVKGLEKEKEGGARCEKCFNLRLQKTQQIAKEKGYDYFATTLTISPLKNATKINEIGLSISKDQNVNYLVSDFKKQGGYLLSIEKSRQLELYRQNYCGCIYSKVNN